MSIVKIDMVKPGFWLELNMERLRKRIDTEMNDLIEHGDMDSRRMDLIEHWYEIQMTNDFKTLTTFYRSFKSALNRPVTKNVPLSNTVADDQTIRKQLSVDVPFCESNPDYFDALRDGGTKLIAGNVQSGKSSAIVSTAIYAVKVLQIPVVILLRCYKADSKQLYQTITERFGHYGVSPQYADKSGDLDFFLREPRITITIEHQSQLRRIDKAINDHCDMRGHLPEFMLIADEADSTAYKVHADRIRHQHFLRIKSVCSHYIGVTATAFDMLLLEHSLHNYSIFHVPIVPNYKGIRDFNFEILKPDFQFKLTEEGRISDDMNSFYQDFLNQSISHTHPPICLQKTQTIIQSQLQTMTQLIRSNHPMNLIVYNGNGVYVHSPFIDFTAKINQCLPKLTSDGYSHYSKLNISDILQHLKDNAVIKPTLIIAGHILGRGINVVSRDYGWHLTHEILQVSSSASCADIVQALRLCGIYDDNYPLTLYIRAKDAKCLKQIDDLQERIFEGSSIHELTRDMPTLCEQIKVFKGLIPKRRVSKKCKPKFNRVSSKSIQYHTQSSPVGITLQRRSECYDILHNKNTGSAKLVRGIINQPILKRELIRRCKELYGILFNNSMLRTDKKYSKHGPLLIIKTDQQGRDVIHPHPDFVVVAQETELIP